MFSRIDPPKVKGEQVHIHFGDKSALNIDGTWKHAFKGEIPEEACKILNDWGFILPDSCY